MRIISIAQTTQEYTQTPPTLQDGEFLWISCSRNEFENTLPQIQELLLQVEGKPLIDFHIQDLLSTQLPSHYDYTSYYDLIVFRKLSPHTLQAANTTAIAPCVPSDPVCFIIYDCVLLTVQDNPEFLDQFANKILEDKNTVTGRLRRTRQLLPVSPDELMLRLVDFLLDNYTDLRRQLTTKLDLWQNALLSTNAPETNWQDLFEARNTLHQLEDLCEDQSTAIKAWQESLEDESNDTNTELLAIRTRDVIEHIERARTHIHRLQASLESAIQLHFSATANRTNHIMRILTVLTAIFLPMNLITGLFGMNFADMFLTRYSWGFWLVLALMGLNTFVLVRFFWKKHYL